MARWSVNTSSASRRKLMGKVTSDPLPPKQRKMLAKIANVKDDDIDFSDIPEQLDWKDAKRGVFYKPVKQQLTLRLDADVVDWFKRQGAGYQTEINAVLRKHVVGKVGGSLSTRARFARRNIPKITFSNLASKQQSSTRNPMLTNYRFVVTYMQLRTPR